MFFIIYLPCFKLKEKLTLSALSICGLRYISAISYWVPDTISTYNVDRYQGDTLILTILIPKIIDWDRYQNYNPCSQVLQLEFKKGLCSLVLYVDDEIILNALCVHRPSLAGSHLSSHGLLFQCYNNILMILRVEHASTLLKSVRFMYVSHTHML